MIFFRRTKTNFIFVTIIYLLKRQVIVNVNVQRLILRKNRRFQTFGKRTNFYFVADIKFCVENNFFVGIIFSVNRFQIFTQKARLINFILKFDDVSNLIKVNANFYNFSDFPFPVVVMLALANFYSVANAVMSFKNFFHNKNLQLNFETD